MRTLELLLFVFLVLPASAQFRYNNYNASSSTNSSVGAYTNQAAVNLPMDVAAGSRADIRFYFSLCGTNGGPIPTTATNPVTTYWDVSMDGSRFTNTFSWSVNAVTNGEAWDQTNIPVTYPWLRYKYMSNANPAAVTNWGIKVGQKTGL